MSSNTLELIAKFKDNASQGLRRLMNETERSASAQGRAWAQASRQRQQAINAYQRLGIRSEQQIRREIQLTQAAYNRLARSGTLSQRELARAAEANRQNIRRLNSELRSSSGQMGRWQRMMRGGGRAFDAVTRGGAALMAGGYVLAQPVRRTMDYRIIRAVRNGLPFRRADCPCRLAQGHRCRRFPHRLCDPICRHRHHLRCG